MNAPAESPPGGKKRIGLFLISDRTGYQRLLAEDGARAARKVGLELEVFSADDTAALQSAQIVKFMNAHPDDQLAVIAMPVSDIGHEQAIESLARRVLSRGVGWIVLSRDLEAHVLRMRSEFPRLPVSRVTGDNRQIGRIQGLQAKALLPGTGGTILYVVGSAFTSACRDRRAGLLEVATKPIVISEVEGMWAAEAADKVVARWLAASISQGGPLDVVACQSDPMALGARQAMHRLGRERNRPEWLKVPVLGVDGLPAEGQRLVDEGTLAATVVVPPTSGPAVELVARAWQAGSTVPPKIVLDPKPYPPSAQASP